MRFDCSNIQEVSSTFTLNCYHGNGHQEIIFRPTIHLVGNCQIKLQIGVPKFSILKLE